MFSADILGNIEHCLENSIYLSKWETDMLNDLKEKFEIDSDYVLSDNQELKLNEIFYKGGL